MATKKATRRKATAKKAPSKKKAPPKANQFKKGKSGNPGGRPKLPPDVRAAMKLNKSAFVRLVNEYLWIPWDDSQKRLRSKDCSLMEMAIGEMALAAANGCGQSMDRILNRLIGKPRDKMELTIPTPFIIAKTDGTPVYELGAEPGED